MVAAPTPPSTPEPAFRGYGVEAGVVVVVLVLAAAVLVPTWLLGGFERSELPEVSVGRTVEYEEVAYVVRAAALQAADEDDAEGGDRSLVVEVHAVNKQDANLHRFSELFQLGAPVFDEPVTPEATLAGETAHSDILPSRLPRNVWLSWTIPSGTEVPDEVTLTLRKRSVQDNWDAQGTRFQDPEPWLRMRVPVGRG